MSVGTVNVTVRNFLLTGGAHFQHLHSESQSLACMGMIAIQVNHRALDLDHGEHMHMTVFAAAFQLATNLYTRGKLGFRDGLHNPRQIAS